MGTPCAASTPASRSGAQFLFALSDVLSAIPTPILLFPLSGHAFVRARFRCDRLFRCPTASSQPGDPNRQNESITSNSVHATCTAPEASGTSSPCPNATQSTAQGPAPTGSAPGSPGPEPPHRAPPACAPRERSIRAVPATDPGPSRNQRCLCSPQSSACKLGVGLRKPA